MTLASEYMIDRRRLRRKLSFWRVAAIGAALAAALALTLKFSGLDTIEKSAPHIARFSIEGLITGDKDTIELLKSIGESKASAVLLAINSPGGTTTGAEKLYLELRKLAEKKPVVVVAGDMAASGAYIAALASDEIFCRGNSIVGSIGVLFEYPNFYKALDTLGIKVEAIKSSPLKAAPNGLEPTSDAAKEAINALVVDSFDWFKGLVKERRHLDSAELAKVADGRIFTGRQALPLKLVDAIGGETEAVAWLEANKGVAKKLPILDWKKKPALERAGLLGLASAGARLVGLESMARLIDGAGAQTAAGLDGLMAIWQGPTAQ
jgi:protease IV